MPWSVTTQNTNAVQSVHILLFNLQWIGNLATAWTHPVEILLGGRIRSSLKQLQLLGFRWLGDPEVRLYLEGEFPKYNFDVPNLNLLLMSCAGGETLDNKSPHCIPRSYNMECINVDMHFKQSLSSAFWNESSQQNNMLNTQNLLGIISKSMS